MNRLPEELIDVIIEYEPRYKLLDGIDEKMLDIGNLSANENPEAVKYCIQNNEKIHWDWFSGNSSIYEIDHKFKELLLELL